MNPFDFIARTSPPSHGSADRPIRLATIDPTYWPHAYPGVLPRVTFDGETALTTRRYAVMEPYRPVPGARVVMLPVGNTYVIAGSIPGTPLVASATVLTGTGTWTRPAGGWFVVEVCGGGGAGGGAGGGTAPNVGAGGGGGAGGYVRALFRASELPSEVPYTVGAAGASGGNGANGGNGGSSTFHDITCGPGTGGVAGGTTASTAHSAAAAGAGGAATGTATGTNLAVRPGEHGFTGRIITGQNVFMGQGGSGPLGAGGQAGLSAAANGGSATGYGAGGGGAYATTNSRAGGAASPGTITILTYP